MAYDANLYLTGTASNPVVTLSTNSLATAAGVTSLKTDQIYHADLRVYGTNAGTQATLQVAIEESASATTGYRTIAAFPLQTAGITTGGQVELGGNNSLAVTFRVTKQYVRYTATLSSTASFQGVSVRVRPVDAAALP